jgi:DNA polymerase III subunit delta
VARELKTIIDQVKSGAGLPLLLLFGEDLRVQEACTALLDSLLPESERAFNLERFDGRATSWNQVEAALNTAPFFPGKKVVWVENVTYFISRDQKEELGQKVLQIWSEGRKDEASRLLLDLLAVEGWTQEQWEQLHAAGSAGSLMELLELDETEAREEAQALVAYCRSKGMDLSQRRGPEEQRLAELLDQGLPPWGFLLMTAAQVDRRTRLYKRLEESGTVLQLAVERDRSGRISREQLAEFVNQRLRQAGKTIESQARDMILLRAADDLRGVQQELEKLLLYVGDASSIRAADVEVIFTDRGEGWVFDLTRSIAERDAVAALAHLARLMGQGEHPLKLLGTIATEVRRLLAARRLIDGELRGRWTRRLSFQQFQQNVLKQGTPLLTRNPYADFLCFERADRFSLAELRAHLVSIHDADARLKSGSQDGRLAMEKLILGMCTGVRKEKASVETRNRV